MAMYIPSKGILLIVSGSEAMLWDILEFWGMEPYALKDINILMYRKVL